MTLRDYCTPDQHRAHSILDAVKGGLDIDQDQIVWALATLGEPVEA